MIQYDYSMGLGPDWSTDIDYRYTIGEALENLRIGVDLLQVLPNQLYTYPVTQVDSKAMYISTPYCTWIIDKCIILVLLAYQ